MRALTDTKHSPYKAAFGISNVRVALVERAQTTLRHVVGARNLQSILTEREAVASEIEQIVEGVSEKWGVSIESILIKVSRTALRLPTEGERKLYSTSLLTRRACCRTSSSRKSSSSRSRPRRSRSASASPKSSPLAQRSTPLVSCVRLPVRALQLVPLLTSTLADRESAFFSHPSLVSPSLSPPLVSAFATLHHASTPSPL